MKRLKQMKDCLISCVQNQINGHLDQVDTKELGEAIDMIKDLEEAIYYCTITKAMEEKPEHEKQWDSGKINYYPSNYNMRYDDNDMDMMYYDGMRDTRGPIRNMHDMDYRDNGKYIRDMREGSSPMYRKMYMESKELNKDKTHKMQSLESYMQELSKDITEMIKDASPEERQLLHQKISVLATKLK